MSKERVIIHCPTHGVSMSNGAECVLCELDRLRAELEECKSESEYMEQLTDAKIEAENKWAKLEQENADLRRALELACNEQSYETGMISLAELGKGTIYFLQQVQKERGCLSCGHTIPESATCRQTSCYVGASHWIPRKERE